MTSGKWCEQVGASLIEVVTVIVVVSIMVILGSAVIAKLGPIYVTNVNATRSLAAPNAALWQIRRDFESMLPSGTSQTTCTLTIHTATSDITYAYASNQITRNGSLLLGNVTPGTSCPYTYVAGSGTTPSQLLVNFSYASGSNETFSDPILVSTYSYKAMPDVSSVTQACDVIAGGASTTLGGTSLTSATGVTFGGTSGTLGANTDTSLVVTTPAHAAGLFNIVATTPEGQSTFPHSFRYASLSTYCFTATGSWLTLTSAGLSDITGVDFSASAGTLGTITDTTVAVRSPAHAAAQTGVALALNSVTPACTLPSSSFRYIALDSYCSTTAGGDARTLTSAGFTGAGATGVTFGGTSGTGFLVNSDTQISVTTPAHATGLVDVQIQGIAPTCTMQSSYRYVALSATTGVTSGGGDVITITGSDLASATGVTFGGVSGTSFSVNGGGTLITVTTPTGQSAGTVDVAIQGISPSCTLTSIYTFI